jgi:hypothetical protein
MPHYRRNGRTGQDDFQKASGVIGANPTGVIQRREERQATLNFDTFQQVSQGPLEQVALL